MLPERALELLTAYVDGELSSRQRNLVVRLLHKSPEARQILKDLQENARQIQQLPMRQLDAAFAGQLVDTINAQRAAPMPVCRPASARRGMPAWARFAVAASVLAVVVGGIVWLTNRQQPDKPGPVVQKQPAPETKPHVDHGPLAEQIAAGASGGFFKPVLPDRPAPRIAFEMLAKTQWQEHIVADMTMQRAVHLEVKVTNQRLAQQRLETVLQNKGIRVERDARVEAMFKDDKQLPPTEFVIYTENIRPDELAAMLYELGTDERARTSIEALTVSSVTDDDQTRLSNLLGIRPEELREPPALKQPLGKFIPKDDREPGGAEPGAVGAASAGGRRMAVVIANEAAAGKLSSQVQYFLNQRRQLQPGALQVIVVVHRV